MFDWYDGPRHGVCALATPKCEFVFDVIDERYNPDGLDDRLLQLRGIPKGTVAKILSSISSLGTPANQVWIPVWKFATPDEQTAAEVAIDEMVTASRPTPLLIWTQDMLTFLGCWKLTELPPAGQNMFAYLKI